MPSAYSFSVSLGVAVSGQNCFLLAQPCLGWFNLKLVMKWEMNGSAPHASKWIRSLGGSESRVVFFFFYDGPRDRKDQYKTLYTTLALNWRQWTELVVCNMTDINVRQLLSPLTMRVSHSKRCVTPWGKVKEVYKRTKKLEHQNKNTR